MVKFFEGLPLFPSTSVLETPGSALSYCARARGRPGLSKVTRDPKTGLTARELGSGGTERAPTTLDASWIGPDGELKYVPTCALDEIKRAGGPMTNEQVGARTRRHRTLVAREVKKVVLKLATEHGTTMDDLLLLADPEHRVEEPSRTSRKTRTRAGRSGT